MTDQFDTTGEVFIPDGPYPRGSAINAAWRWPDLSPGVQGCIAAMLENADRDLWPEVEKSGSFGFSDLHPDTLARIIADWERFVAHYGLPPSYSTDEKAFERGLTMWRNMAAGAGIAQGFPPLKGEFNDEGKVCLRERDQ